ncbi:helix-turn-helix domain-containing protein [Pseudonocardia sp.]|uniref:PucR family transcriptional regulator n=1 Tax=Pseudonocardia sp. TaxID=60912 RepID=UPI00260A3487|nr:helix-turn-helix domain-containing protein [Pseudonocardia sp.]
MTVADAPAQLDRDLLSSLRSLLVLGKLMTEGADEQQILELAATAAPSLARCNVVAVELAGRCGGPSRQAVPPRQTAQLALVGATGGRIELPDTGWAWAYPLSSLAGHLGHLLIGAAREPSNEEQFLLRALAQQTGGALANRRLHAQELATAAELSALNERLQHSMNIHTRLTAVAVSGEGSEGIARAVHELTGLQVAIEDRYGNLQAWAGPNRPDPYPKDATVRRDQLLSRAKREARPIRDGGRVLALAHPQGDALGAIVLIDPQRTAGEPALMALEHGATILAMELARVRSLAESELRLRRDLVDELLNGTDEDSGLARAMALGYDLQRPHRVVVIEGRGRTRDTDTFFQAVRRAARDEPAGTLLVARGADVVLLADCEADWESLRKSVMRELGGGRARLGVGECCERVAEFPRSYQQAKLALRLPAQAEWDDRAIRFDDLGVYRLLVGIEDLGEVERFVQHWLGKLLDYDEQRGSELVRTLSHYLKLGGSYELTAKALIVHRNTLKYRLQRIRQIGGLDLGDPETWFNLQLATRAWATLGVLRCG